MGQLWCPQARDQDSAPVNSLSLLSLDFLQMFVRIDMNFSNVATAKGALPVAASMLASRSRQTIGYKYS